MRARTGVAVAVAALLLAACAPAEPDSHAWGVAYDYGTPGAAARAYADVAYYPACSNEVLTFDGRRWFPFEPANAADFPSDPLSAAPSALPAADTANTGAFAGPVGAVVAPGPGDDVGTLVIYVGDLAYWESDSGKFHTWLTNHEIEYNWAC